MIPKQLAVSINKNNTTAVSAASKPHSRLLKSKTFISKWMFPASTKKRFNPIAAIEYETSNLNNLYLWINKPIKPINSIISLVCGKFSIQCGFMLYLLHIIGDLIYVY